jgi:hypothetical protein
LYPNLANWYVADKEASAAEAVAQSKKRVTRAKDLYRARVVEFVSSTLKPSGFFDVPVQDTTRLLTLFAGSIEQSGHSLFLGENGLVDDLSTDDVKLMCTLAWRADGNEKRRLPEFRFVYDPSSASQLESALRPGRPHADMLIITTDFGKKSRIKLLVENDKLEVIKIVSISSSCTEAKNVESVFISYTAIDENWAKWIGRVLMSAGYDVTVQYKDFLPGSNFVKQMDEAIKNTDRTVAVLSPPYLASEFAAAEWQAAFRDDPLGQKRKLVPVRIAKTSVKGLLGSIVYADLVGLTEKSATAVLLGAIGAENRPKLPQDSVAFPGSSSGTDEFQAFLTNIPDKIERGNGVADAPRRLQLALTLGSLSTNQINILVYALNPPDNEIPPVSAPAKDRAAALLDWTSRERIELSVVEELVNSLSS